MPKDKGRKMSNRTMHGGDRSSGSANWKSSRSPSKNKK